jgi:hypothetical protein
LDAKDMDASAQNTSAQNTSVGIEGLFLLRNPSPSIEVKTHSEPSSLLIRLGSSIHDGNQFIHQLYYIGMRPGEYDLHQFLCLPNGEPWTANSLAIVSVRSVLADDDDGQLASTPALPMPKTLPYRWIAIGSGLIWLAPLAWRMDQRIRNRTIASKSDSNSKSTLADRLEPLILAAIDGRCSPQDQATIERAVIGHWRTQLQLQGLSPTEAIQRLRSDPTAGKLLRQLDQWLYMRPQNNSVDLKELLEPYRQVAINMPLGDRESQAGSLDFVDSNKELT